VSGFLLDTNVISELVKPKPQSSVTQWIEATDESLLYLNHKILLMNGTLVYMKANTLPFAPIIYKGYEKQDVRDPYFTSPIIKMSPIQKMATVLANKYVDGIELHTEPPIVYDSNDPQFAMDGGPRIEPGAKQVASQALSSR